jgi:hypothetical protein
MAGDLRCQSSVIAFVGSHGPYYLVSIHKWPFFASSASICRVSCAVYYMYTSAQLLDFLDLAKNCSFLNWKLYSAHLRVYGRALSKSEGI